MKALIKPWVAKLVISYLVDMYNNSDDRVLKGAITKVLKEL